MEELSVLGFTVNIVLTLCAAVLGYLYAYYHQWSDRRNQLTVSKSLAAELPDLPPIKLTLDQLLRFDGTRSDGRILVALKGKIYDVSSDFAEFGLKGTLSHVAGRDFSNYLESIMDAHKSEINYVDRWEAILVTNYSCVGIVIDELGNPLVEKIENHIADVVEETQEDFVEPITANEKSVKTLNEVLTAETLPSDIKSEKSLEENNSEIRISEEVSEC
ncbi:membrane-associated progesterone receptor component 1 [Drosophila santomea]|uniref:membrane-associated progesterone receptor component 1 n=1 Tax=Drosophila santomea TaxID=129105 RepID=UPI001952D558|nr:membrane-associated progesterone receptor component 1 [Drosophila santomea]